MAQTDAMGVCVQCGEAWASEDLNADGICVGCRSAEMDEFEDGYEAYVRTYRDFRYRDEPDSVNEYETSPDADEREHCPRCGQRTDRLLGVTHRGGETRHVCEGCRADALDGSRSFWHWFHKEADVT